MALAYVITSCCLLIYFRWHQEFQARSYPFVGISCLYGIYMLVSGTPFPVDGATVAILSLSLWMLVSLLWTEKPHAMIEIFLWYSYFILFMAARTLPLELVLWILLVNPAMLAGVQLCRLAGKYMVGGNCFPVFGNSNHNAAFMIVGFYSSLYLGLNGTPWLLLVSLLTATAITTSGCRGATIALLLSVLLMAVIKQTELCFYLAAIVVSIALGNGIKLYKRGIDSSGRIKIYKDAFGSIAPKYLTGRGLNYFRLSSYGRVHNDHLELVGEVGLIGYGLLLNIFYNLHLATLMFCALVSFLLCAVFFFPFREVHTAAPFWALMGVACAPVGSSFLLIKMISAIAICLVLVFVFTVFCNLVDWDVSKHQTP